jgi:hypothetical protein
LGGKAAKAAQTNLEFVGAVVELDAPDHVQVPVDDMGWGLREVEVAEPARLRLFFLSLLWRAATSNLYEFADIVIEEPVLNQLRDMILAGTADPQYLFPIQLNQPFYPRRSAQFHPNRPNGDRA